MALGLPLHGFALAALAACCLTGHALAWTAGPAAAQGSAFGIDAYRLALFLSLAVSASSGRIFAWAAAAGWAVGWDCTSAPLQAAAPAHVGAMLAAFGVLAACLSATRTRLAASAAGWLGAAVCYGGIWTSRASPTSALWSWDPVETTAVLALGAFLYPAHAWAATPSLGVSLAAVAAWRLFRLSAFTSTHHLSLQHGDSGPSLALFEAAPPLLSPAPAGGAFTCLAVAVLCVFRMAGPRPGACPSPHRALPSRPCWPLLGVGLVVQPAVAVLAAAALSLGVAKSPRLPPQLALLHLSAFALAGGLLTSPGLLFACCPLSGAWLAWAALAQTPRGLPPRRVLR